MIDFGYGISPSSVINLDKFDRTMFEELAREEPDVLKCMACGSCAASCPSSDAGARTRPSGWSPTVCSAANA